MSSNRKPIALTVGATLLGSVALAGPAFAMTDLASGYMQGAVLAEGNCGADKAAEGKCGEGKCGVEKMDTDGNGAVSQAEFAAAHDGDASRFAGYDANNDGQLSADEIKARHEGTCGADKGGEGKCGEGKCGGMA